MDDQRYAKLQEDAEAARRLYNRVRFWQNISDELASGGPERYQWANDLLTATVGAHSQGDSCDLNNFLIAACRAESDRLREHFAALK